MDNNNRICKCSKFPVRVICIEPTCQQNKAICYTCISNFHLEHEGSMMTISDFEQLMTQQNIQLDLLSDSQCQQTNNLNNQITQCYQLIKEEIVKAIDKWYEEVHQCLLHRQQSICSLITKVKEKQYTTDTIEQIMKQIKIDNHKYSIRQTDKNQGLAKILNMIINSQLFCQKLQYSSKKLKDMELKFKNENKDNQLINPDRVLSAIPTQRRVGFDLQNNFSKDTRKILNPTKQTDKNWRLDATFKPLSMSPNKFNLPKIDHKSVTSTKFYPQQNQNYKVGNYLEGRSNSQRLKQIPSTSQKIKHFIKIQEDNNQC